MTLVSGDELAEQDARLAMFFWILTATFSLLLCFVQLGVMVSLLAGRALFSLVFPAAVLGTLIVNHRLLRRSGFAEAEQWRSAGLLLLLLGSSLALSSFFFNFPGTKWYHQAGIIHIGRD